MKIFKRLALSVSALCLSALLLSGCIIEDPVNTKLDGVWTRGDIDVRFQGNYATFTRIEPNCSWDKVRAKGGIRIGDKKFKNITGGNLHWTGLSLTYNTSTYEISSSSWHDCTITMDEDGKTIEIYTYDVESNGRTIYSRK